MDDLRPLVDDPDGSPLGRALLASARGDAPSPQARARAARRLGIAAVLAVGAGTGTEAGALVVAGKLAAVLLALGGVVGLAMWQSPAAAPDLTRPGVAPLERPTPTERAAPSAAAGLPAAVPVDPRVAAPIDPQVAAPIEPRVAAPIVPPRATPSRATPRAQPARRPPPPRPPVQPTLPQVASQPAPVEGPAADPTAVSPAPPAETTPAVTVPEATPPPSAEPGNVEVAGPSRLAVEVALVDRARARLGARDYPAALAALAEYHQRFPGGDLGAEADMVMIEILIAQREVERARALGTAFLARFPRSPLSQRVHSLLDRLPK